ncbi:MAG TPA: hypothetical protein VEI83_13355 [Acidimicrobiales bacterium]|nr:hypothetical protein [Acidimicrobiales bacterium]
MTDLATNASAHATGEPDLKEQANDSQRVPREGPSVRRAVVVMLEDLQRVRQSTIQLREHHGGLPRCRALAERSDELRKMAAKTDDAFAQVIEDIGRRLRDLDAYPALTTVRSLTDEFNTKVDELDRMLMRLDVNVVGEDLVKNGLDLRAACADLARLAARIEREVDTTIGQFVTTLDEATELLLRQAENLDTTDQRIAESTTEKLTRPEPGATRTFDAWDQSDWRKWPVNTRDKQLHGRQAAP